MAGEVGGVLEIPQSLFDKFDELDKKIEQVGTKSEWMSKKFTDAIDKMTGSLGTLNIGLGNIQTSINNIDLSKITDNVDKLSKALSQMGKVDSRGIVSNTESSLQKESDLAKKTYLDKLSMYERLWKKMDDDAKKAEDTARKKALAEERANERIRKAQELSAKKEAFAKSTTFEGAMDFAKSANSINQRIEAIKRLTIARNNLSTSTENYDKKLNTLNSAILKLNKANADAITGSKEMKKHHSALMDTSGQLARKFALIFSVSQIQGYVRQLVSVRGEFELQQRALQAILQNKDEADRLFGRITELAVRSPYQVKELVTYTKQLAAYRVESSKLYDTTKMLADVSSGLGVDMQRLILAYGQVKAANYLRGTELRQFSEAGINILGELATYFSELKGQAISVGDVFEMVSSRMVSFADVEEIFKRITSAGGIFYNMQEIQAETLKGQLSNLRDEIDLMFNEIGKANDGTLKNAVSVVKSLVENWQVFVPIIKGLVVSFGALKLVALASSKSILEFATANNIATVSSGKMVSLVGLLNIGFKKVATSAKSMGKSLVSIFKGNIWTIAITALIAGIYELYSAFSEHSEQIDAINKKYNDLYKSVKDVNVKFDYAISSDDLGEQKKLLSSLINIANNDYQMNIKIDYSNMTSEKVIEAFNTLKQSITDANRIAKIFATTMQEATEWTIQDDIFEDFEQLGSAFNTLDDYVYRTKTGVMSYLIELGEDMTDVQRKALEMLQTPKSKDENELQYLERLKEGYKLVAGEYLAYQEALSKSKDAPTASKLNIELAKASIDLKNMGIDAKELSKIFEQITKDEKEATKEFNNFADDLIKKMPSLRNMSEEDRTQYIKLAIDKIATENEWNDFQRLMMYKLANTKFNISIGLNATEVPEQFSDFEKKFQEYQDKKGFTFKYKIEAGKGQSNIMSDLKSQLDDAEKTLAMWENANKKMDVYTEEKIKAQKVKIEEIRDLWLASGGALSTTNTKSTGKSVYEQRLDVLKQMQTQYEKLLPYFSKEDALQKVILNNQKEINSVGLQGIEDLSKGGLVKILEDMLNTIPARAKDARKAIEKELSTLKVDVDIDIAEKDIKHAKDRIDNLFNQYKISIDLDKLGIDKNISKDLFGIETLNFDDLYSKINNEIQSLSEELADDIESNDKDVATKRLEIAKDAKSKLEDIAKDEYNNRMKNYVGLINEYADIQTKINKIEKKGDEERSQIEKDFIGKNEDLKNQALQASLARQEKEVSELRDNVLKSTWLYQKMFGDIKGYGDYTLSYLIKKGKEMTDEYSQNTGLGSRFIKNDAGKDVVEMNYLGDNGEIEKRVISLEEYYKILKQIRALQDEKYSDVFFGDSLNAWSKVNDKANELRATQQKYGKESKQAQMAGSDYWKSIGVAISTTASELVSMINDYGVLNDLLGETGKLAISTMVSVIQSSFAVATAMDKMETSVAILAIIKLALTVVNAVYTLLEQKDAKLNEDIEETTKRVEALVRWYDKLQNTDNFRDINKLAILKQELELRKQIYEERIAQNRDEITKLGGEYKKNMSNAIKGIYGALLSAGTVEMALTQGILNNGFKNTGSGIANVLTGGIYGGLKALFNKKGIKNLEKANKYYTAQLEYQEKLTSIIASNASDIQKSGQAQIANLEKQNQELQAQIDAEMSKKAKNRDYDKINEWQEKQLENTAKMAETWANLIKDNVGDVFNDLANGITDALMNAFDEVTDPALAFEEAWDDAIKNVLFNLFRMNIIIPAMKQWMKKFFVAMGLDENGMPIDGQTPDMYIDEGEAKELLDDYGNTQDSVMAGWEQLLKLLKAAGIEPDAIKGGNLSGLQQGIQGVTEQTAQALEAYMNSIRFFVADSNSKLNSLYFSLMSTDANINPMYEQLRLQTAQVTAINKLLNSVAKAGHSQGGYGIKVFM